MLLFLLSIAVGSSVIGSVSGTASLYGGGEKTGKLSSGDEGLGFNSELGGEEKDILCGSK